MLCGRQYGHRRWRRRISGGKKQRISIARAMLKNAHIVILDEATANVDPENEDRLQKAIEALTRDKTIIMIAHRMKTVRHTNPDSGHRSRAHCAAWQARTADK